jgi:hypothetical protein
MRVLLTDGGEGFQCHHPLADPPCSLVFGSVRSAMAHQRAHSAKIKVRREQREAVALKAKRSAAAVKGAETKRQQRASTTPADTTEPVKRAVEAARTRRTSSAPDAQRSSAQDTPETRALEAIQAIVDDFNDSMTRISGALGQLQYDLRDKVRSIQPGAVVLSRSEYEVLKQAATSFGAMQKLMQGQH